MMTIEEASIFIKDYGSKDIYNHYTRQEVYYLLQTDPYRLVEETYFKFKDIDRITMLTSFEMRKKEIYVGILSYLRLVESRGQSYGYYNEMQRYLSRILSGNRHKLNGNNFIPYLHYFDKSFIFNEKTGKISFTTTFNEEIFIKDTIRSILRTQEPGNFCIRNIPDSLDYEKKQILQTIQNNRLNIITGGAGTGKTTWLKTFIRLVQNKEIYIAATTGKASRRTVEVLHDDLLKNDNLSVGTIHSFLNIKKDGTVRKNLTNVIDTTDILIIDEASMLDDHVMFILLTQIMKKDISIIFIGDVQQLPSVEVGNVLRDLMLLGVNTYTLKTNHRSNSKNIISNANKILCRLTDLDYDENFVIRPLSEALTDETSDILITPYRCDREYSTSKINEYYKNHRYNDDRPFHVGDEIIFERTDYAKGYINGCLGTIIEITPEYYRIVTDISEINSDDEETYRIVNVLDEEDIALAHSITIHKSQGSEYDTVGIILPEYIPGFTSRNLLYTAITRAQNKVIFYTTKEILEKIITAPEEYKHTFISDIYKINTQITA